MANLRVVIGGSFAALEGLLRLRRLATDGIALTLVSPVDELRYRPLTVLTPFTGHYGSRATRSRRWRLTCRHH